MVPAYPPGPQGQTSWVCPVLRLIPAWLRTADEHGPDAQAHHEEAAEPVEQVDLVLQLAAVRVQDRDRDQPDEAVEHVELRRGELVAVERGDAEDDLHEHRPLRRTREP